MQIVADRFGGLPHAAHFLLKVRLRQQASYLVLIFVGHHLEQVTRYGLRQSGLARRHLRHECAILLGIAAILVLFEFADATFHQTERRCFRLAGLKNFFDGASVLVILASPQERLNIPFRFDTVEADRFFDGRRGDRNQTALICDAQQENIYRQMAGEQSFGESRGIHIDVATLARAGVNEVDDASGAIQNRAAANRIASWDFRRIDHRDGARWMRAAEIFGAGGAEQIEAQDQIGVAVADLGSGLNGTLAENNARNYSATFLSQTRLVERDHRKIFQPCGRGKQGVDGYDTRAADARRKNRIAVACRNPVSRLVRLSGWQLRHTLFAESGTGLDLHCDERRAVTHHAGVVFVARGLMDARFLAELGLDRMKAHAVRLAHAIAAALAD